jgi:alanine dehydrogenase
MINHHPERFVIRNITGVAPTEVVILGAGTVGEFAARTALGFRRKRKVF